MSIYLNDTPIEALGLALTEGGPALNGFGRDRAITPWLGRTGGIASRFASIKPRVLQFAFVASRLDDVSARASVLQSLSDLLQGLVEVRFDDGTHRRILGYCSVYDATVLAPSFVNIEPTITVEITCPNAAFEDVEPRSYRTGPTPIRIEVGTAGHGGRLYVTGATGAPFTVTYRNVAGVAVGRIACSPSLAAHEQLIIDLDTEQFIKVDAATGDWEAVPAWNTEPNSTITVLPRDAARELNAWPTIESSVNCWYVYRRHWEN